MKNEASTLLTYRERVNRHLEKITDTYRHAPLLREAMQYALLDAGKRMRPLLVYAAGESLGQSGDALDSVAAAVECIHAYSLIHDDLPAMDDDSLRRGKPTVHLVFGEAMAILAGDALQTTAFELLSIPHEKITLSNQLKIIQCLAQLSGANGMVGGQALDILSEGKKITETELKKIHQLKTGALIQASILMGAFAANSDDKTLGGLTQFAQQLGLAFQLQDDLQDVLGDTKNTGKNTQQDSKHQKATYPALMGVEATQNKINALMRDAMNALESLSVKTDLLKVVCSVLISNENLKPSH